MKLHITDQNGKKAGTLEVADSFFGVKPNEDVIAQYVRVYQFNQRQGNANTKTKADVSGGGKKPWRQKGTGRARQGSIRSPQFVHGGVAHGPKTKSWQLSIPAKVKKLAFASAISLKIINEKLVVVDALTIDSSKTKDMLAVLKNLDMGTTKTLIVTNKSDKKIMASAANLKKVAVSNCDELNAYDLLNVEKAIFTKEAIQEIERKNVK